MDPMPMQSDTLAIREGVGVFRGGTINQRIHAVVQMVAQTASSKQAPNNGTQRTKLCAAADPELQTASP